MMPTAFTLGDQTKDVVLAAQKIADLNPKSKESRELQVAINKLHKTIEAIAVEFNKYEKSSIN